MRHMTPAETKFHEIGTWYDASKAGKFIGKPCYTVGGKPFICFYQDEMVFRLPRLKLAEAMLIPGARPFDPHRNGRPIDGWVQLPLRNGYDWSLYASAALQYVAKE